MVGEIAMALVRRKRDRTFKIKSLRTRQTCTAKKNITNCAMETWATLQPDTPFNQIFPDGRVPIKSIVPIIPRSQEAPTCYVVDADFLSENQILELALGLYQTWRPECTSVAMAIDYIRRGLPLSCEHFSGVSTSNPAVLAMLLDEPTQTDFDDYEDDEEL